MSAQHLSVFFAQAYPLYKQSLTDGDPHAAKTLLQQQIPQPWDIQVHADHQKADIYSRCPKETTLCPFLRQKNKGPQELCHPVLP